MAKKEIYEGKELYTQKKMLKNSEIDTLTEDQHEILRELCYYRHQIHINHKSIFLITDDHLVDNFNDFSKENNLPFNIDYDIMLTVLDYEILTKDQILEYEKKAKEINKKCKDSSFYSAYSLWCEENFENCCSYLENLNNQIENFLRNIDKKHGTQYAPTGLSRFRI